MKNIKKIFLKLDVDNNKYDSLVEQSVDAIQLYWLFELLSLPSFDYPLNEWIGFKKHINKEKKTVCLYSDDYIKQMADISFRTEAEFLSFDKEHHSYFLKRSDEMPQINLSIKDFKILKTKLDNLKEKKSKYLIFELDNSGAFDKVSVKSKDRLSLEDQVEMHSEHQKYLRREKAFELYKEDHPFWWYSDYWYGADDSFFEADLEPYYDRETPLLEKKKYTKKQIGLELKEKVAQKEYSQFLGKWFYQTLCSNIVDTDDHFNNLLKILYPMERYPEDMPSYEKLDEIADLIVAGRDDEIKLDF